MQVWTGSARNREYLVYIRSILYTPTNLELNICFTPKTQKEKPWSTLSKFEQVLGLRISDLTVCWLPHDLNWVFVLSKHCTRWYFEPADETSDNSMTIQMKTVEEYFCWGTVYKRKWPLGLRMKYFRKYHYLEQFSVL